MGMFGDILKEKSSGGRRYSQGRIYLFVSFVAFLLLNVLLAYYSFSNTKIDDIETLQMVSTNLKWALGSFSLYVLGGKGIGAFRDRDTGISNDYDHEREGGHYHPYGGGYYKPDKPYYGPDLGYGEDSFDIDEYQEDYDEYKQKGSQNFGEDQEEIN